MKTRLDSKIVFKGIALLDKVAKEWEQWARDSRAGRRDLNVIKALSAHLKDCVDKGSNAR